MELFIVCVFIQAAFARIIGANIKILTEGKATECGGKFTLTCKIEDYSTLVAWMFDNDTIPIVRCLRNKCSLTMEYDEKYKIDYNVNEGFYNLTIMKLTIAEIGRTFVCTTGTDSVSKTLLYKDYRAMLFEDAETHMITASSGFISPDANIAIKWTKIYADDNIESDFDAQRVNTTEDMHSNVSLCSTNQLMQYSVTISANPSRVGNYYLKIAVTYGNETVISNITSLKYKVEEQDLGNGKESDPRKEVQTNWVIISVVLNVILTSIVVGLCITIQRTRYLFNGGHVRTKLLKEHGSVTNMQEQRELCRAFIESDSGFLENNKDCDRSRDGNGCQKRTKYNVVDNKESKSGTWPDLRFFPIMNSRLSKSDDVRYPTPKGQSPEESFNTILFFYVTLLYINYWRVCPVDTAKSSEDEIDDESV